jgi:enamine deaminase RidA (YjgF/YER057c/UK114 family)
VVLPAFSAVRAASNSVRTSARRPSGAAFADREPGLRAYLVLQRLGGQREGLDRAEAGLGAAGGGEARVPDSPTTPTSAASSAPIAAMAKSRLRTVQRRTALIERPLAGPLSPVDPVRVDLKDRRPGSAATFRSWQPGRQRRVGRDGSTAMTGIEEHGSAEQRLAAMGIELPGVFPAAGNYLGVKRHRDLLYVSGHGPLRVDEQGRLPGRTDREIPPEAIAGNLVRGKVGADVTVEQAREAARLTGLFLLAALRAELGSLDRVASVLKVFGMVNCTPGFTATPAVIDGCSDLLVRVFGRETGAHARSAIGVAELPFDICVEIEMVVAAG